MSASIGSHVELRNRKWAYMVPSFLVAANLCHSGHFVIFIRHIRSQFWIEVVMLQNKIQCQEKWTENNPWILFLKIYEEKAI